MSAFMSDHRHPSIREVEGYWQALRAGRLVPRRSEIDPRGIERSLEYAFILERIAPGIARLRIAGSHLSDLMGMEVRGMPISSFFTPAARNLASDVLEQVFDGPATAELSLSAERGVGKPAIDARMILLPMKSDLGDISRALGCLSTRGAIGRAPRRFVVEQSEVRPLIGAAVEPRVEALRVSDLAEDAARFEPAAPAAHPHLRLVHRSED
ncbi:PAS domain-containing protein [Pseudooceanicola sp. 216_PA32_1]|uniref:PAS domain-containing protein n=2 Tax=Pseudooceanicola pacificus TaxID=2676438 RepID=A0A844W3T0_9RHOB|nr:PAS domain-containing protein [Pseudooceanicola pacificus]